MKSRESTGDAAFYYAVLLTVNVTLTAMVLMAACLWCRRQPTKDELGGLEGMVKMTNPDDIIEVKVLASSESQTDLNTSAVSTTDSEKRASTAAHRSLPDIPIVEGNGDNGSELYETVADKNHMVEENDQNHSPAPSLKKQISVSQHSSISQADDISSPYSRVRNPPHDYAKVRNAEHPYAQVNPPSTSAAAAAAAIVAAGNSNSNAIHSSQPPQLNGTVSHNSNHSSASQNLNDSISHAEIPAASAIAGMISASQDLPYMTPPIISQHFSGDSQDSSKGYTSISVREPLANILAQQPPKQSQRVAALTRETNDSHYATVSDDSDETYAAIEDPNIRSNPNVLTDIYTSGSETYAQIQPMQTNSMVVSVEINNISSNTNPNSNKALANKAQSTDNTAIVASALNHHNQQTTFGSQSYSRPISEHVTPIPPPIDSLRTQKHSRQASSSSNNSSSICTLGSPKPEKRQANSPLPPTPKSNITSGRSSVISVIECGGGTGELNLSGILTAVSNTVVPASTATTNAVDSSPQKNKTKSLSPSKDIEGMYAKVMKKNKLSHHSTSSQNSSPVMARKGDHLGISPLDMAAAELMELNRANVFSIQNASGDKSRIRSNSYGAKDHGYETIPADVLHRSSALENRKSDCYSSILHKERPKEMLQITNPPSAKIKPPIESDISSDKHYETIAMPLDTTNNSDPGYETLQKPAKLSHSEIDNGKKFSDYDPNYEVLEGPNSTGLSDDGYAKINERKSLTVDEDSTDGYSKVKGEEIEEGATGGYSIIATDANHNYASIAESKAEIIAANPDTEDSDHYARIAEAPRIPQSASELPLSNNLHSSTGTLAQSVSVISSGTHDTLAITSPSSVNLSSLLANSSTLSSTNVLTGSGSGSTASSMSSRQTPSTSSQYESLTGSEADPNYETVCYTNTENENPYERLQTEYSDTQLSSSSPLTPEELRTHTHNTTAGITDAGSASASSTTTTATNSDATVLLKSTANGLTPKSGHERPTAKVQSTSELNSTDVVVDDYFQV